MRYINYYLGKLKVKIKVLNIDKIPLFCFINNDDYLIRNQKLTHKHTQNYKFPVISNFDYKMVLFCFKK